jgi:hypothetical protein
MHQVGCEAASIPVKFNHFVIGKQGKLRIVSAHETGF